MAESDAIPRVPVVPGPDLLSGQSPEAPDVAARHERATAAFEAQEGWLDRVRAGLLALLEFFDEQPALARYLLVHSAQAGPAVLARLTRSGLIENAKTGQYSEWRPTGPAVVSRSRELCVSRSGHPGF